MDSTVSQTQTLCPGNHHLTDREAVELLERGNLLELGAAAQAMRHRLHPDNTVSFVIDRNVNYTDGCVTGCGFCGFHCHPDQARTLQTDELLQKVKETNELEGDRKSVV